MKYFSDQELEEALHRAPKLIQNEMTSSNTIAEVVASIGYTLNLHIVIGAIVQLSVYMLLGLINPQEFSQELAALGLSEAQIKEMMAEINQKIFAPLHEQMRSGGGSAAPQAPRIVPPVPPKPVNIPMPNYYAPPPQSPAYRTDTKTSPPFPLSTIAPLPPKVILPQRGAQASINQLENRGTPTPLQQALRTVLSPANLPGALPLSDIIPPALKTPPSAPYSTDPYRESFDEK